MLMYIDAPYFCDWKPGRFTTTSLRRKSNKFRYEINPFNNVQLQKEHPLLPAIALNNQPITGPVTHYNDVSITFASKTTKPDHPSFFSKLVKQTNHSMLIFVQGYAAW